jgi:hypothetical protein
MDIFNAHVYIVLVHQAFLLVFTTRKHCRTLTLQGVRRTLEEDLKLAKKALDAFKKFITTELDRVSQKYALVTCMVYSFWYGLIILFVI